MLGCIGNQVFDRGHDVVEKRRSVDQGTETRDLASDGGSHLGLVILQQFDECRD